MRGDYVLFYYCHVNISRHTYVSSEVSEANRALPSLLAFKYNQLYLKKERTKMEN